MEDEHDPYNEEYDTDLGVKMETIYCPECGGRTEQGKENILSYPVFYIRCAEVQSAVKGGRATCCLAM